jgi:hypothetical protein
MLANDNCFTRLLIRSVAKIIGNDDKAKVRIIMTVMPGKMKFIVVTLISGIIFCPQRHPAVMVHTIGKANPKIHAHGFLIHLKKLSL